MTDPGGIRPSAVEENARIIADIREEPAAFQDSKHLFRKVDANILDIDQYGNHQEKYYSGNQVSMYIDSSEVDELTSISFQAVTDDGPAYSYNAKLFNTLIPGKFKVIGTFSVNFTKAGYVYDLLLKSDSRMNRNVRALIDQKRQAARREQSRDPIFKEREKFRQMFWGSTSEDDLKIDIEQTKRRMFTLSLLYGNPDDPIKTREGIGRHTLHRISHAKIVKVEQSVAQDGQPVQEVYTFIARTIDDPTEIQEVVPLRPKQPPLDEAKRKELLIRLLRHVGKTLFTYLTDPDTVDVKIESVLKEAYLKDIPVLKMRRSAWDEKEEEELQEKPTGFWSSVAKFFVTDLVGIKPLYKRFVNTTATNFPSNSITSAKITTVSGYYFRIKPSLAKGNLSKDLILKGEDNDLERRKRAVGNTAIEKIYERDGYSDATLDKSLKDIAWKILMDKAPITGVNSSPLSFNMDPYVVFDTVGIANGTKILGAFGLDYQFDGQDSTRGYIIMNNINRYDKWYELSGLMKHLLPAWVNLSAEAQKDENKDRYRVDKPQFGTITVTNSDGSVEYVDGEDYEINYGEGKILILSTGAIQGTASNDLATGTILSAVDNKTYNQGDYIKKDNDENIFEVDTADIRFNKAFTMQDAVDASLLSYVMQADIRIYFQKDTFLKQPELDQLITDPNFGGSVHRYNEINPDKFPDSFVPFSIDSTFRTKGEPTAVASAKDRMRTRRDLMTNLALSNSRILAVDYDRSKAGSQGVSRRTQFNEAIVLNGTRPNKLRVRVIEGQESPQFLAAKKAYTKGSNSKLEVKSAEDARSVGEASNFDDVWGKSRSFSNLLFLPFDDKSRELFKEERDPYKPKSVPSIIKNLDDADSETDKGFRLLNETKTDTLWIDITDSTLNECYISGDNLYLSVTATPQCLRVANKGKPTKINSDATNELQDDISKGKTSVLPILTAGWLDGFDTTKTIEETETLMQFYVLANEDLMNAEHWESGASYDNNQIVKYEYKYYKATKSINAETEFKLNDWDIYEYKHTDFALSHEEKGTVLKADIRSVKLDGVFQESGYTKYQFTLKIDGKLAGLRLGKGHNPVAKIAIRALPEASLVAAISTAQGKELQFYNDFPDDPIKRADADQSVYYFVASTSHKHSNIVEGLTIDVIVPRIMSYITSMGFFFDYLSYIDNLASKLISIYTVGGDGIGISFEEVRDAISDGIIMQRRDYGVSSNRGVAHNVVKEELNTIINKTFMNEPLSDNLVEYLDIAKSEQTEANADEKDEPLALLNNENYLTLMKADNSFEASIIANIIYKHHHEYLEENFFENLVRQKYGDEPFKIPGFARIAEDETSSGYNHIVTGTGTTFLTDLAPGLKIKFGNEGKEFTVDKVESDTLARLTPGSVNIQQDVRQSVAVPIYVQTIPKAAMSNMLQSIQDEPPFLSDLEKSKDKHLRHDLRWNDAVNAKRNILPMSEFTFLENRGIYLDAVSSFLKKPGDLTEQTKVLALSEQDYKSIFNKNKDHKIAASQNSVDFTFDFYSTVQRPIPIPPIEVVKVEDPLTTEGDEAEDRKIMVVINEIQKKIDEEALYRSKQAADAAAALSRKAFYITAAMKKNMQLETGHTIPLLDYPMVKILGFNPIATAQELQQEFFHIEIPVSYNNLTQPPPLGPSPIGEKVYTPKQSDSGDVYLGSGLDITFYEEKLKPRVLPMILFEYGKYVALNYNTLIKDADFRKENFEPVPLQADGKPGALDLANYSWANAVKIAEIIDEDKVYVEPGNTHWISVETLTKNLSEYNHAKDDAAKQAAFVKLDEGGYDVNAHPDVMIFHIDNDQLKKAVMAAGEEQ